jgi:hypothetical protein
MRAVALRLGGAEARRLGDNVVASKGSELRAF